MTDRASLSIGVTLKAVVRVVRQCKRPLAQAVLIPSLVLGLMAFTSSELHRSDVAAFEAGESTLVEVGFHVTLRVMASSLIAGLVGAVLAVSCHRIILIGANSLPNRWGVFWSKRELRFFGWVFLLGIPSGLALMAWVVAKGFYLTRFIVSTSGAAKLAATVLETFYSAGVVALVIASVGLVLPATALDERPSLKAAWKLARGNVLRLAAVLVIPLLLVGVLFDMLNWTLRDILSITHLSPIFSFIKLFLGSIGSLLGVIEIAALSVSYRTLTILSQKEQLPRERA